MPGWGSAIGKIFDLIPGRKESYQNEIERLIDENAKLAKQYPLPANIADRIQCNANRIKLLRSKADRIA